MVSLAAIIISVFVLYAFTLNFIGHFIKLDVCF